MKRFTKPILFLVTALMIFNISFFVSYGSDNNKHGFELISSQESEELGCKVYQFKHIKTGAEVIFADNKSDRREFSIGFKTPPKDSKGANHVLEHSLLCGSEKYPVNNIISYISKSAYVELVNGFTEGDMTYYSIKSANQTEYYNLVDVYLNGIFHPLLLNDRNIFYQQGVRLEYDNGKVKYNGVVYNEQRGKNLETAQNSLNFVSDKLYALLYGNTSPAFSSAGNVEDVKNLTYDDLMKVYNTYYIPSNSMTYIAGKQDIDKTLAVLDSFFSEFEKKNVNISFNDTKQIPAQSVNEYNITENTKTVDIGFMSSGAFLLGDIKEEFVRDIIFNIIFQKMSEKNEKIYSNMGNTGGISNSAVVVSEIPIDKKDQIIAEYNDILKQLETNGFNKVALDNEIESYITEKKNTYVHPQEYNIFYGLIYHDDPLCYVDLKDTENYLKENKEYFNDILKKYFTQNKNSVIVVSGNGGADSPEQPVNVGAAELEQIKRDTEAFKKWADTPNDPAAVAKIPFLSLNETEDLPQKSEAKLEEFEGIKFYYTEKDEDTYANLYFPVSIGNEDMNYMPIMLSFLGSQAKKAGFSNAYFGVTPMKSSMDGDKIKPQIFMEFGGDNVAGSLKSAIEFLKNENTWDLNDLDNYIKAEPKSILKDGYGDPFYISYELKQSALSAADCFSFCTTGALGNGNAIPYYHFIKELDAAQAGYIAEKIKTMCGKLILNSKPVAEYVGSQGYGEFKEAALELFRNAEQNQNTDIRLPIGYNSAAIITDNEDANHFMMTGYFSAGEYSEKLTVLAKVLNTYTSSVLRGKYGAYGTNVDFTHNNISCSVSNLADIDTAVNVWKSMGDYLRNLDMTQKELDAVIVSAVKDFDNYEYTESEYGARAALTGVTERQLRERRQEIMSVTVADIKSYADFIDRLTAQSRIFAVLGKQAADKAQFRFAYYADAKTLDISARFKKDPGAYMKGRSESLFAPDEGVTRAEIASLISRLMADERRAQLGNIFSDVNEGAWYYNDVLAVYEKNIMTGIGSTFEPDKRITRAELAAVLSKFIFRGESKLAMDYSDMSLGDWFYEPMAEMINAGYFRGYEDGTIRPDNEVSRAELTAVMNRMLGISAGSGGRDFSDVSEEHWAYGDIMAAVS
ncbi:MAG: hypothetical protein HFE90_08760 [Firmicutes bacterium]|nr:hypothetical protein [Bacillota bacterium]